MRKLTAWLQLTAATLLGAVAVATLVNLALISTRPETISVANTFIGQGVLLVCLVAAVHVLVRSGRRTLTSGVTSSRALLALAAAVVLAGAVLLLVVLIG